MRSCLVQILNDESRPRGWIAKTEKIDCTSEMRNTDESEKKIEGLGCWKLHWRKSRPG